MYALRRVEVDAFRTYLYCKRLYLRRAHARLVPGNHWMPPAAKFPRVEPPARTLLYGTHPYVPGIGQDLPWYEPYSGTAS